MTNATVTYFGQEAVERAIANFFLTEGVNEANYHRMMAMEVEDGDAFFEMVESFLENETN